MENCISFNFNDPIDLEKKILSCKKNGDVYAVIIEPYSASLLESCSQEFIDKLFFLKNKFHFRIIYDEVFTGFFKSKKMFYFENFKINNVLINLIPPVVDPAHPPINSKINIMIKLALPQSI